MSTNMSTPEKHQKNKKIENTNLPLCLPTMTPKSCTSASRKPSNLSEVELKSWPPSSSTPSTSKPNETPGHSFSAIEDTSNSTKITQALAKSFLPGGTYYHQQEILIIFWVHKFISMYPSGMLFKDDGQTPKGLLIPTWTETVLRKRHESTEYPDAWYNAWDDWCRTPGDKKYKNAQHCGTSQKTINRRIFSPEEKNGLSVSTSGPDSGNNLKKKVTKKTNHQGKKKKKLVQKEQEEQKKRKKKQKKKLVQKEQEDQKKRKKKHLKKKLVQKEQEDQKKRKKKHLKKKLVQNQKKKLEAGESEGFSSRGEGSSSESVRSDTHSSEYSETSSGDISCTEHKREEMESNNSTTDGAEESQTGIFPNKRKAGEGDN